MEKELCLLTHQVFILSIKINCNYLLIHYFYNKKGLADIVRDEKVILDELKNVMEYTYPGPHAFIIVLSAAVRYTNEEKGCVELISGFFGIYI